MIKNLIKKYIPKNLLLIYHRISSILPVFLYLNPSSKMVVIGITGTKGKTTSSYFIHSVLSKKYKVGMITTSEVFIGKDRFRNKTHQTMPKGAFIQKTLKKMLKRGCSHCVIETTSEGIKYMRHFGINYDYLIFTNLSPEHLPAHNNDYTEYRKTKEIIFKTLTKHKRKILFGRRIKKINIVNNDDNMSKYFSRHNADQKISFSIESDSDNKVQDIKDSEEGVIFTLKDKRYILSLKGDFNIINTLPAIIIGEIEKVEEKDISQAISQVSFIPGRMQELFLGQDYNLIVDYAHEAKSMKTLMDSAKKFTNKRIIVILGAEGGNRDPAKRASMGKIVGEQADIVIVSNVDPYEESEEKIARPIKEAALSVGKREGIDLFMILDRREAIKKALLIAREDDTVLITGKGHEVDMIFGDRRVPWSDEKVIKEEYYKLNQ